MRNYRVIAIPSEGLWHLSIDGLAQVTQARTLDEAPEMAKDLIHLVTGEPVDDIQVSVVSGDLNL